MLDECNEGHYKFFKYFWESDHRRTSHFKKVSQKNSHRIPFNPSKQHAMNTNLIIECTECNKACVVYAQSGRVRAFKRVTHDLSFVCGSSVKELVGSEYFKEFHMRQNLKCIDQVEVLYYSAGFISCYSHCCTKHTSNLSCGTNEYPVCSDCAKKKKQPMR